MATGRTDYPNQVNNVLGFPFIFRGALDVRATQINEAMKMAAVKAIAGLAKEEVPDSVKMAYANQEFKFGKNYLIPKPFDKRVLTRVAPAVAKAAMDSGVARVQIADFKQYIQDLEDRLGVAGSFTRSIRNQIPRDHKKRIIFSEGSNARILQAASLLKDEGFIEPILFGDPKVIQRKMKKMELLEDLQHLEIINPDKDPRYKEFSNLFYEQRQRLGVTISTAKELMKNGNYFCSMMVKHGHADGMITGTSENYGDCITPIMKVVGKEFKEKVAGIIILVFKNRVLFLADCTVQINPNASELSDIAISATTLYRKLMKKEPSVAFLSYSNFGSNRDPETKKIAQAVALTKEREPNLDVDGEMHADVAVNHDLLEKLFNFSTLQKSADILVFPELQSANISYKLLAQLAGATPIGPVLVPLKHAINIVQRTSSVDEIINMTHLTAVISEKIKRG
jgi:malate dehydrogenase (oxaloacetate-decarboxylating)(NADP+)